MRWGYHMNINSALDVLKSGESAIVLFTRGLHLFSEDGKGWSGYWKSKPERHLPLHRVVIYDRPREQVPMQAKIYVADYAGVTDAPAPWLGRTIVHFEDAQQVGVTNRNWNEFADTGTSPVRYFRKK